MPEGHFETEGDNACPNNNYEHRSIAARGRPRTEAPV
jgi:hypothetical protein